MQAVLLQAKCTRALSLLEMRLWLGEAGSAGRGWEGCGAGIRGWHPSASWGGLRQGGMRQGSCLACVTSVSTRSGAFGICCCSSALAFQSLWRGEVVRLHPTSFWLQHNRGLGQVWHFPREQRLHEPMRLPNAVSLCLRTCGVIPRREVLRTGQVVSFVPGDSAGDPEGSCQPGGSRVSAPTSSSCQLEAPGAVLAQGRCPACREGVSPQPRLCCPTGTPMSHELGERWRRRWVPCWGAHPWKMLCQMVVYRALWGVWRAWDGQGTSCSQIFLHWTSPQRV